MIVQRVGYIIPFALVAAFIGCISNGLYSTFSPNTSTAKWVGYQILNGIGRGVGMPLVSTAVPDLSRLLLQNRTVLT
jgi:hypothetical protein